jgi:hypothetical protein
MPIPLQTLITLTLYDRLYTYIKRSVSGNKKKKMRKPPLKESKFRRTKGEFYFQTKNSVETVDPKISSRQQLLK